MRPVLFEVGGFEVASYSATMFLAFLAAAVVVTLEVRRRPGWDAGDVPGGILTAAVSGLAGAKLYQALFHWNAFVSDPARFMAEGPGMTFYGGLIAGIVCVSLYVVWKGYPLLEASDVAAPSIPLGYAIGRIGCFLVGDDYGVSTDLPWAMAFPRGAPPITTPVHPTQLYEVAGGLAIFAAVWGARRWDRPPGALLGLSLTLMGVERFLVEFVRRNPDVALGLTMAQWISVGLALSGLALWLRSPRGFGEGEHPSTR